MKTSEIKKRFEELEEKIEIAENENGRFVPIRIKKIGSGENYYTKTNCDPPGFGGYNLRYGAILENPQDFSQGFSVQPVFVICRVRFNPRPRKGRRQKKELENENPLRLKQ